MLARVAVSLGSCLAALGLGIACSAPPSSDPTPPEKPTVAPAPASAPDPEPARETKTPVAPGRPADDLARDELRKPQAVMDLFELEPGGRVVELMAGAGYYAELLSRRVGGDGTVWAHNTPFVLDRFAREPLTKRLSNPALANVVRLDTELEAPQLPSELDAVLLILFYHDLYWQGVDRAAMNRAVFEALRPGGVFGVIDHAAISGHGSDDVKTLHRVEESLVIAEIEEAGFILVSSADLLRHPEDSRDTKVFAPPDGRDRTDRFVLKFRKPSNADPR